MNKYQLLILLNAPLALYGLLNAFLSYKLKRLRPSRALVRILFWLVILVGIWFTEPLSALLHSNDLTTSPPLSIYDVLLTTGAIICFLLIAQAHGRIADLENRLTRLHEKLSIEISEQKSEGNKHER
jgi:hypothetical protein